MVRMSGVGGGTQRRFCGGVGVLGAFELVLWRSVGVKVRAGVRDSIIWELPLLNVLSIKIKISNKGTAHGAKRHELNIYTL